MSTSLPHKLGAGLITVGTALLAISTYLEMRHLDFVQAHPIWANLLSAAVGFCFGVLVLSAVIGRAVENSRLKAEANELTAMSAATEAALVVLLKGDTKKLQFIGFSGETRGAFDRLRLHCRFEGTHVRYVAPTIHRVDEWLTEIGGPRRLAKESYKHHYELGGIANDSVADCLEPVLGALDNVEALLRRANIMPTAHNATALLDATIASVIALDWAATQLP